jgi:TonB family protein
MFEGVEAGGDDQEGKRKAISTGVSLAIYGVIGAVLLAVGGGIGAHAAADDDDDEFAEVSFKAPAPEPPKVEEPPPPPPKAPKPKRKKKSSKPAAAPTVITDEQLAEGSEKDFRSTVNEDIGVDIATPDGDGDGSGGGVLGGKDTAPPPPPPPPPPKKQVYRPVKAVYVEDNVQPPVARSGNAKPEYPEAARKAGKEALVILRVLIKADGSVGDIKVLQGKEPFLAAATSVVKAWSFSPATIDGKPSPFHLLVRVPFRLKSS